MFGQTVNSLNHKRKHPHEKTNFHPHRTPHRHRDHRDSRQHAAAGAEQGALTGEERQLPGPSQTGGGYTGDNGDFFPPVSNGIYGESNDPYWKYLFAGNTLAYLGINAPRHPENGKVDYFYGTYTLPTLQCPASTITYTFSGGTVTAIPSLTGYNPYLGGGAGILAGTNNPTPKKVYRSGGVRNSSVKVLISEYYAAGTFYNKVSSTMETAPRHIDLYTRHGGRLNYSFVDGHVEAYPWGGTGSSGGIQVQLLGIGNEDTKINFTRHWLPNR